jgi:hypothetical protein
MSFVSKSNILKPLLSRAVAQSVSLWPAYDGTMLDRSKFITSSEIGGCAREARYKKDFPPQGGLSEWGYAERGHAQEAWIVQKLNSLSDAEYTFEYLGEAQRSFYEGVQSGTPDGVAYDCDGNFGMEFKSIDPRFRIANLPKPPHVSQVLQNVDLLQRCTGLAFEGAMLSYTDASDFSKVTEFWVDTTDSSAMEETIKLRVRAEWIMSAASPADLPPEGVHKDLCKYCAFTAKCSDAGLRTKQEKENHGNALVAARKLFG